MHVIAKSNRLQRVKGEVICGLEDALKKKITIQNGVQPGDGMGGGGGGTWYKYRDAQLTWVGFYWVGTYIYCKLA